MLYYFEMEELMTLVFLLVAELLDELHARGDPADLPSPGLAESPSQPDNDLPQPVLRPKVSLLLPASRPSSIRCHPSRTAAGLLLNKSRPVSSLLLAASRAPSQPASEPLPEEPQSACLFPSR
eukprot:m.673033 g.673033  ORF g.673033 m.673033 type:complete len:123 (-) comp58537_c0_seq28:265-633(-)